jgi:hypothetical protein
MERGDTVALFRHPNRRPAFGLVALLLAVVFFTACRPTTRKLDEVVFYEGPRFRLKLVRYFENYPLHYTGEVFRVQCASPQTQHSPAHRTQDAGWVTLGNGGAIGSRSAAELVQRERVHYRIVDESTLVWIGNGVNVSYDACGSFRSWHPTALPEEWIIPVEKPDHCKPKGRIDCRHLDFIGERAPRYDAIEAAAGGQITFRVRSMAFRSAAAVQVESTDFGKTWHTAFIPASEE